MDGNTMGGRGTGSGFSAGAGGTGGAIAEAATKAAAGGGLTLDFTSDTDHYREAQHNPQQVISYMHDVQNMDYTRPVMSSSGDIFRMLEPDRGTSRVRTGLRAVVTQVALGPSRYRTEVTLEHNGTELSTQDASSVNEAREIGRKMILIEMRRRGIY